MSNLCETEFLAAEMHSLYDLAVEDAKMANKNGVDLNPFTTQGGRLLWQQGWDGVRPANLVDTSIDWRFWVRGGFAKDIAKECEDLLERPQF